MKAYREGRGKGMSQGERDRESRRGGVVGREGREGESERGQEESGGAGGGERGCRCSFSHTAASFAGPRRRKRTRSASPLHPPLLSPPSSIFIPARTSGPTFTISPSGEIISPGPPPLIVSAAERNREFSLSASASVIPALCPEKKVGYSLFSNLHAGATRCFTLTIIDAEGSKA